MCFPDYTPSSEDEASYQHSSLGEEHYNRTVYKGEDGLLHVRCDCGWDSADWEAKP